MHAIPFTHAQNIVQQQPQASIAQQSAYQMYKQQPAQQYQTVGMRRPNKGRISALQVRFGFVTFCFTMLKLLLATTKRNQPLKKISGRSEQSSNPQRARMGSTSTSACSCQRPASIFLITITGRRRSIDSSTS